MVSYLSFDGFTSTWQDKMFKGFTMTIYNQILYVQACSAAVSITSLVVFGQARALRGCMLPPLATLPPLLRAPTPPFAPLASASHLLPRAPP